LLAKSASVPQEASLPTATCQALVLIPLLSGFTAAVLEDDAPHIPPPRFRRAIHSWRRTRASKVVIQLINQTVNLVVMCVVKVVGGECAG
jgi:hypothetical protein